MRLVLTGGEHVAGLAAARALRRAGHEPHAAIVDPSSYVARSRAVVSTSIVPDPRDEPAAFAEGVAALAQRVEAAAVLPGVDAALFALEAHRDLFGETRLGVPPLEVIHRATDKSLLGELALEAGLRTPDTTLAARADVRSRASSLGYPLVVKPSRSDVEVGNNRRMHVSPAVVRSDEALRAVLDRIPGDEWLIQPFMPSVLGAVAGVAWDGGVVCTVHQRAVRIWPPECGISSYAVTVPRESALEQGVAKLVEAIGWSGVFQAQFLHAGNEAFLIDFNPRFYGSLALAVGAGLNLPAIWLELLCGRHPGVQQYRVGVHYRTEEGDVRALARAASRGEVGTAIRGLLPRRHTVHPIFELRDPLPIAVSLRKLIRR